MPRLDRVQQGDVISERGAGPAHPPLQPADVCDPRLDHARLSTQTYLTVEELTVYLRFPSERACRAWVTRTGLPKCRRGGRILLVLRRDVDEAVQPRKQTERRGRHTEQSVSAASARKGHAR